MTQTCQKYRNSPSENWSLFISMPIKYIISGPALGPKPFFNMDWSINTGYVILSCYYSLPSNWLVHSFRDEQYREGDCVIVQGSLEKNALFLGRLYDWISMEDRFWIWKFPWKLAIFFWTKDLFWCFQSSRALFWTCFYSFSVFSMPILICIVLSVTEQISIAGTIILSFEAFFLISNIFPIVTDRIRRLNELHFSFLF